MRVIAGKRRGIPLRSVSTNDVRPTTDRIKETLFNIIGERLSDARFLDLFAGSGQIGIEALSRGARSAVFVDSDRRCISIIKENLKKTRLAEFSKVLSSNCRAAVGLLAKEESFDIIFMDPPYQMKGQEEFICYIGESGILSQNGLLILEADSKRDILPDAVKPFSITREKIYKTKSEAKRS